MKLSKSLEELDALADELLSKSVAKAGDEDLNADDVSESVENPENNAEEETEEKEEDNKAEEKEDEEIEKCNGSNSIKKSEDAEETEDVVEKSEDDMDLQKSEDEEEEPATEEEPEEEESEETSEDIEKSMTENFTDNEVINKSMVGNEFLSAVVEVLSKSLADVQYDILSKSVAQSQGTDILAKSLQATLESNNRLREENTALTNKVESLEKSMAEKFESLTTMLEEVSKQPAQMRKSVADINTLDRNFDASIGSTPTKTNTFESLSKSQVLQVLENELYSGNINVTPGDIISYESGAPLRQELQSMVTSKLN